MDTQMFDNKLLEDLPITTEDRFKDKIFENFYQF